MSKLHNFLKEFSNMVLGVSFLKLLQDGLNIILVKVQFRFKYADHINSYYWMNKIHLTQNK